MTATAAVWQFVFGGLGDTPADDSEPHIERPHSPLSSVGARGAAFRSRADDGGASEQGSVDLVRRIRAGEEPAFRALYLAHAPVLTGVAHHILHDAASAEDVVHDVFAGIWTNRERFSPDRVSAYLVGAVRRRALDRARHARVVARVEDDCAEDVAAEMAPAVELSDHAASNAELARALAQAVHRLPERRRTALLLRVVHGVSYQEIGQVLGIGTTAAHMLVTRTLASLRPSFERFLDDA